MTSSTMIRGFETSAISRSANAHAAARGDLMVVRGGRAGGGYDRAPAANAASAPAAAAAAAAATPRRGKSGPHRTRKSQGPAGQVGSRGGPLSTAHGTRPCAMCIGLGRCTRRQSAGLHPTRREAQRGRRGGRQPLAEGASAEPGGPKSKAGHAAAWGADPCRAAQHPERPSSAYSMQPAARQVARKGASRDGELARPTHVGEAACGPASPGAAYTNLNRPVHSATARHCIA